MINLHHSLSILVAASTIGAAMGAGSPDTPPSLAAWLEDEDAGWVSLFDGKSLEGWVGDTVGYKVEDGAITCSPEGRNLYTAETYGDFLLDFEFKLAPGSNNGVGIRAPREGDAAYVGMELQVIDNSAEKWANLQPWQYHGSIYGVVAAERGHLKPVGEWNRQQVICIGDHVKVVLNGATIVDAFLDKVKPIHDREHPGLEREDGHIAFLGHGDFVAYRGLRLLDFSASPPMPDPSADNTPPAGFRALFNGNDLAGWEGLVENPIKRRAMDDAELAEKQKAADENMRAHWKAEEGEIRFDGKGQNLCTVGDYGDFEAYIDWKIPANADSGIYLRGTPQVQIWDPANKDQHQHGADKGSGGLWNNKNGGRDPLVKADKPIGEWNTFFFRMIGEKVSIWLNGQLVVDNQALENYWDREQTVVRADAIELQNHGQPLFFKNLYVRDLPW